MLMIRLKTSPVWMQICCWLLFMSFPLLFLSQGNDQAHFTADTFSAYVLFNVIYIAIYYLNTEVLIPAFFLTRKYLIYFFTVFLLLSAVFFLKPFHHLVNGNFQSRRPELRRNIPPPPPRPDFERPKEDRVFDITSVFIFIMMIGIGAAFKTMKQWHLFETRAIRAEAEKANAELLFLKAQINPHFLYNTLNNIYTLCITGSENAAESIMKLSNIMRYVTDESEADFVPLQDEMDCISNFIALQKLRLGKKVTLEYTVKGDAKGHRITPLILMNYVENVFKYGLSNHMASAIEISIEVKEDEILFSTRNQLFEHKKATGRKGVGLYNTQKRLNYLYPGQHTLKITEGEGLFTVLLILRSK